MKKPDFSDAMERLHRLEGRDVDHPKDPGGETWMGITRRDYPEVWRQIENADDDLERMAIADGFYWREFWARLQCDALMNHYVADWLFEAGVNMGRHTSVRLAQLVVNGFHHSIGRSPITVDGLIGPQTQGALNALSRRYPLQLVAWLNVAQGMRYLRLALPGAVDLRRLRERPDRFRQFLVGWGRRLVTPSSLARRHGL